MPDRPTVDPSVERAIERRVLELLTEAGTVCARHRAATPEPRIRFDLRGRSAGQAVWCADGTTELRFNLAIARRHREHFLLHSVTHEVAHLVTVACHGRVRPHGPEWRASMARLGIPNPQRCHDYPLHDADLRHQRRWDYACACTRHRLTTTRHNRIQRDQTRYYCRQCGTPLRLAAPHGD